MGNRFTFFGVLLFIGVAFSGLSEASTYNLRRLPLHWDARRPKVNSYGDLVYARANGANFGDVYLYRTLSADPGPFLISRGIDCFRSNDISDIPIFNFDISDSGQIVFGCRSAPGGPAHIKVYDIPSMTYSTLEVSMEGSLKISRDGTKIFFYGAGHYVVMTNGSQVNVTDGFAYMNRAGQVAFVHRNDGTKLHGPDGAVRTIPERFNGGVGGIDYAGNVYISKITEDENYPAGLYRWPSGAAEPTTRLTIGGVTPSLFLEGNPVFYQVGTEVLDGLNSPGNHVIGQGDSLEGLLVQNVYIQSVNEAGAIALLVYREHPALPAIFYSGPVMPDFKVLLNGKEYLFDDCAPFNDPCKSFKSTHKAGEFLRGDTVKLEAQAVIASDTCEWSYGPVGGQATTLPVQNCSVKPEVVLPTSMPEGSEDFEVSLKMNNFPERKKLLKARERIEINFANAPTTNPGVPYPYPTFNQAQFPGTNVGNGTTPLSHAGCGVTALATIGELRGQALPNATVLTPPNLNTHLRENEGFNSSNNLLWNNAIPLLNQIQTASQGGAVFTLPAGNPGFQGRPFWPKSREQLEHLARKRAIAILWVHTLQHPRTDAQQHLDHKHYVVLRGLEWKAGATAPHVLIHDPGHQSVRDLDLPWARQDPRGYGGHMYGAMVLAPTNLAPRPNQVSTAIGDLTITIDGYVPHLVMDSLGRRVGGSQAAYNAIPGATQERDGLANDGEGSGGENVLSWTTSYVPTGSVIPGRYVIQWSPSDPFAVRGSAVLTDGGGRVIRIIPFQGTGGTLELDVSPNPVVQGSMSVTGRRFLSTKPTRPDEVVIRGTLSAGSASNGWSPISEPVAFKVFTQGDYIPAGSFIQIPSGEWAYYLPDKLSGIYDARISPAGEFLLKARGMGDLSFKPGQPVPLAISIGDDEFLGRVPAANSISKPFVQITPSKILYQAGEDAAIRVKAEIESGNPETEIIPELKLGNEILFPREVSDGIYVYVLSSMTSGAHILTAQAYLQNKRLGQSLRSALSKLRAERAEILAKLEDGVDSGTRRDLEERLGKIDAQISGIREELSKIRRPMGAPEEVTIYVQ